jgi:hypothetical protein
VSVADRFWVAVMVAGICLQAVSALTDPHEALHHGMIAFWMAFGLLATRGRPEQVFA